MEFLKLIRKHSAEIESQKSETSARTELISGKQQCRSIARSTGVHKRAQGSPVDRDKGTVDRGSTD